MTAPPTEPTPSCENSQNEEACGACVACLRVGMDAALHRRAEAVAALTAAVVELEAIAEALGMPRAHQSLAAVLGQIRSREQEYDAARAECERMAEVLRWLNLCGGLGQKAHDRIDAALARPSAPEPEREPTYPCDVCGKLRTKAEGGTTFTVCDECWDATHDPAPGSRGEG